MKTSYITNLMSSFYLWLDHEILFRGEAFTNYSGSLYETPSTDYANTFVYSSPFRQWVYDNSIPNAIVASGVYINNIFTPKLQNGLRSVNYNKGQVEFYSKPTFTSLTANYSFKEYNLYYTDEREEKLLFEKSYSLTPKFHQITGGLGPLDNPYPCIFIKHRGAENIPFAFGGEDSTQTMIRCVALASNSFSLDGLISILSDSARKVFPLFPPKDFPFTAFGDLGPQFRESGYNYINMCKNSPASSLVNIDNVTVSKLDEIDNSKINKKCVGAFIDFDLSDIRSPRSY